MKNIAGRRALITGSTRGIGAAVAEAMAAAGVDLILSGREAEALSHQASSLAQAHHIRAEAIVADLAVDTDVFRLASEGLEVLDGLDILVNNAGVSFPEPLTTVSTGHWDMTMAVNLRAPCLLASLIGQSMARAGQGKIINMASAAGLQALANHYAYSVSKAGLIMATKMMALELGPYGVQANAVCPTVVMTEMGQKVWGDKEKAAPLLRRVPAGHFAAPADVASAVLYLASPVADMVNGTSLPIDGGYIIA